MLGAPLFGLLTWPLAQPWTAGGDRSRSGLVGPVVCLVALLPSMLAVPLGHSWEVARQQRTVGLRIARLEQVSLREVLPQWLLWSARLLAVLALLATPGAVAGGDPNAILAMQAFGCLVSFFALALPQPFVRRYYRRARRKPPLPPETVSC